MNDIVFYIILVAAVVLLFLLMLATNRYIKIPTWKLLIFAVLLFPVGLFSGKLMRLVEAGTWEGVSYFGAVLFAPVFMAVIAWIMREKPFSMLDLCAPVGGLAVGVWKFKCLKDGCCLGRIIFRDEYGSFSRFPSREVELIDGFVLMVIMLLIIRRGKQKGLVYFWFLLLYGATRFVLDLLRDTEPFILGMSAGCFWALVSVIIGGGVLLYKNKIAPQKNKSKKKNNKRK